MVQELQTGAQVPGATRIRPIQARRQSRWQGLGQVGVIQPGDHGAAQIGLRQAGHRGVNRRQSAWQLAACGLEAGVHHGQPHEAALHLAAQTQAVAYGQGFLMRGVKAEKSQHAGVRAIVHRHQQLPAGFEGDLTGGDRGLHLHRIALAGVAQLDDARLVLVAQRQMQRQIDVAVQPQLAQGFLRRRKHFGFGRFNRGRCHAQIVHAGARSARLAPD